jgi:hypothetical protein
MNRHALPRIAMLALAAALLTTASLAQTPKPGETASTVPAFDAMHEVMMPMWHEAWPNKDIAALTAAVPALDRHVTAIAQAELPGILREKAEAWKAGVVNLQAAAAAYKTAARAGDNAALLKAAEALHTKYEALGRVIRPALKELDAFHGSLYTLFHYELKPFELTKVTASVQTLVTKMDALNKAVLPDRLKAKADAFAVQRTALAKSVDAASASLASKDAATITAAVEALHAAYEALDAIFK